MGLFKTQSEPEKNPQTLFEEPKKDPVPVPAPLPPKPRKETIIEKGITVAGKIFGEGAIQVGGCVEGEINVEGSVFVAVSGLIKGPVVARTIRVAGSIEGSVAARDRVRLEKTGSIIGDVTTASLIIEEGGRLNGRSTMETADNPVEDIDTMLDNDLLFRQSDDDPIVD